MIVVAGGADPNGLLTMIEHRLLIWRPQTTVHE
jgi:hypothetical protein